MTRDRTDAPVHLGRHGVLGRRLGGMATVLARSSGAMVHAARRDQVGSTPPEAEEEFVRMFLRRGEGRAARIRHPNVVGTPTWRTATAPTRDGVHRGRDATSSRARRRRPASVPGAPSPSASRFDTPRASTPPTSSRDENDRLQPVHRKTSPQNIPSRHRRHRLPHRLRHRRQLAPSLTCDGQLKGKISHMAPEQTRRGEALTAAPTFRDGRRRGWEVLAGRRLSSTASPDVEVLNQLLRAPCHACASSPRRSPCSRAR